MGLPGDENIIMHRDTNDVTIGVNRAVRLDRNLCDDKLLQLINRLLENGKGKDIEVLGKDGLYVLGDCKAVLFDSRVFVVLSKDDVIGKPLARSWPLQRMTIKPL